MDAKIKDNAIEPTVSGILTHVQTKTVKMEQSAKEVFLDEVISLLRKAGSRRYSYGPVAVLTFLAFRNDNIYLASDAVATFKSRTKAYEMIKDGKNRIAKDIIGRCGLPSGSPEEKKLEAGVKMANENLAASAIGRYFCECGAPKIYPEIEAAILDGQLSIAMEKVEGTPITDSLLNPRINIDEAEFREIVKRVCDGAKNKENYLGVSSLMCGSQFRVLCIPEEPIDFSDKNEKYKDSDNIMFYSADKEDSKYNFTLASDITEEPFLMPMQEYAIQILNSSLCGNVNMKGGYDVQFLFRPFRDGDFVVFGSWFRMEKEGPKKFLKYRMPYFPGEFAGKILRSASWLQLLDWLVNYWDRETSSNTILTGGNELHSIDFDGCCGDWDRMKPSNLPIVVDSEMFAVIKNLDPEKIKDIALSSGMSQENAELTERRAAALKSHAEDLKKDGKVISPDKWGEQTADAYAHTFSNSMFGCRAFGSNFPEKLRDFTENRDKLAPRAEAETEGELCVRKFAGEFAKLREKW
ncbi:MAG: hypothetical protein LBB14_03695 [Puniceicoccales bacterium]|nr:hypothetical protein [Puniceicoccales bacterium]